ncbi:MAG: sialidase family protein [Armatimonadota bacterium]
MTTELAVALTGVLILNSGAETANLIETRVIAKSSDSDYYAFPSVCRLADGELLCVFYLGTGHISSDGHMAMVRSRDESRTWTRPVIVADTPLDDRDPSIMQTRTGRIIISFFVYDSNKDDRVRRRSPRVHYTWSDDGGKTFCTPRPLEIGWNWSATSDEILQLADGTLLMPIYARQEGDVKDRAAVVFSKDDGKTWSGPTTIACDESGKIDFQEPAIAVLPDGRILCSLRTTGAGFHAYQCESTDGGKTWTKPVDTLLHGHAATLLYHSSGVIFQAYRSWSEKGKVRGVAGIFTEPGKPWNPAREFDIMLVDGDSAYPSAVELSDGTIFCVYYAREHRAIEAAVIPPSAIKALR